MQNQGGQCGWNMKGTVVGDDVREVGRDQIVWALVTIVKNIGFYVKTIEHGYGMP